eukprot:gnl/TRDRNA2_/TRDRNA2_167233_c0_seq4.p1 gnl/TRDRNA2_/TRDRNA2_167233_c0~~gnl/TRDRNA2_/TRDRNA2_167233_c0_seq4.p1  ORF type:complete len:715 (-),score=130.30 gnl/TRDRNA2_/TRDRNA2_167233_c0_seq4:226-2076(-)
MGPEDFEEDDLIGNGGYLHQPRLPSNFPAPLRMSHAMPVCAVPGMAVVGGPLQPTQGGLETLERLTTMNLEKRVAQLEDAERQRLDMQQVAKRNADLAARVTLLEQQLVQARQRQPSPTPEERHVHELEQRNAELEKRIRELEERDQRQGQASPAPTSPVASAAEQKLEAELAAKAEALARVKAEERRRWEARQAEKKAWRASMEAKARGQVGTKTSQSVSISAQELPSTSAQSTASSSVAPPPEGGGAPSGSTLPAAAWSVRKVGKDNEVYVFGPWCASSGPGFVPRDELNYYNKLGGVVPRRKTIFGQQLFPTVAKKTSTLDKFGWMCNMTVVKLPSGGCLVYSPILGPDDTMSRVEKELQDNDLLPVEAVIAPEPTHHLALTAFQECFPDAAYVCGSGSTLMPPLREKRPDIRWDCILDQAGVPVLGVDRLTAALGVSLGFKGCPVEVIVVDDARGREIVLLHHGATEKSLICATLLYKSSADCCPGPGGPKHRYCEPEWFAEGMQELFYRPDRLLPTYRAPPKASIDVKGMQKGIQHLLSLDFSHCTCCHLDPLDGTTAKMLLQQTWASIDEAPSTGMPSAAESQRRLRLLTESKEEAAAEKASGGYPQAKP